MTTTDDLTNSFNDLALEQYQATPRPTSDEPTHTIRHLLTFDFPALWLLQDVITAHLHEPHLMNWREKPDPQKYHIKDMPTMVSHLMGPEAFSTANSSRPSSPAVVNIIQSIDSLRQIPGQSVISAIAHTTAGKVQIRLGLTTEPGSKTQQTQICDLATEDWEQLIATQDTWTKVLADLVYRKSARAYLAAENRLMAQNHSLYQQDRKRWKGRWSSWMFGNPNSPVQLFRAHLRRPYSKDVVTLRDFVGGSCGVVLPCDHEITLSEEEFEGLTDGQCRVATCKECSASILQPKDKDEVEAFDEHAKLQEYHNAHSGWAELDNEHFDAGHRNYQALNCQVLVESIGLALESFDTPAWIQPKETSLANSEAAAAVSKCLQTLLAGLSNTFEERPSVLLGHYHDALSFGVPNAIGYDPNAIIPGWSAFVKTWLLRAMNFTATRRCISGGSEHKGYHYHGKDLYWQDAEGAANHLGEDMEGSLVIFDRPAAITGSDGPQYDPLDTDDRDDQWWMNL